jgi:putative transcriptional regulator
MTGYLTGQLLIAMPQMDDTRFRHTVLLVCQHDSKSAMGVILNQRREGVELADLSKQLEMGTPRFNCHEPIYNGGPVEQTRGVVVHSGDHILPDSVIISPDMAMTSNIKILSEISDGIGPNQFIIALGHASWTAGQLDQELRDNIWLTMPYDADLIFSNSSDDIWGACFNSLGISRWNLSANAGHA